MINEYGVLTLAIQTYGPDMQQAVAIEEMAELTKELCKRKRGADNLVQITEEIADVEIMLEQLKIMFDNEANVLEQREFKIKRLADRLRGESI